MINLTFRIEGPTFYLIVFESNRIRICVTSFDSTGSSDPSKNPSIRMAGRGLQCTFESWGHCCLGDWAAHLELMGLRSDQAVCCTGTTRQGASLARHLATRPPGRLGVFDSGPTRLESKSSSQPTSPPLLHFYTETADRPVE